MAYNDDLIAAIDARIAASAQTAAAKGQMTSRSGVQGMVVFDGSDTAVPVLVSAECQRTAPGDRVGLLRLGRDWVVVCSFTSRALYAQVFQDSKTGSTSSTTFADVPGPLQLTVGIVRSDSTIRAWFKASGLTTNALCGVQYQLVLDGVTQSGVLDETTCPSDWNHSYRAACSGNWWLPSPGIGSHTWKLQWRINPSVGTGTGTWQMFGDDLCRIELEERP